MTVIELPEKLQRIGNYAFAFSDVTLISLPASCQSIGSSAFTYCKMTSIALPSGVMEISKYQRDKKKKQIKIVIV